MMAEFGATDILLAAIKCVNKILVAMYTGSCFSFSWGPEE
jgi:hypothetical protein